jgi:hypothetical protein
MAKKKASKASQGNQKKTKIKDLAPKPASTRMVVGGRRRYITN